MKVPGIENPNCTGCNTRQEESVQHYLLDCRKWQETREETLGVYKNRSLGTILGTREGSRRAVVFLLRTKRLEQFRGVRETDLGV